MATKQTSIFSTMFDYSWILILVYIRVSMLNISLVSVAKVRLVPSVLHDPKHKWKDLMKKSERSAQSFKDSSLIQKKSETINNSGERIQDTVTANTHSYSMCQSCRHPPVLLPSFWCCSFPSKQKGIDRKNVGHITNSVSISSTSQPQQASQ